LIQGLGHAHLRLKRPSVGANVNQACADTSAS
jgi:hypothetical protein